MSESLVLFPSDDEEAEPDSEVKLYNNFTAMLKGVPPPSSITVSKFTVDEMLERYKNNENTAGFGLYSKDEILSGAKRNPAPFINFLNTSLISENLSTLAQKVQERYVQLETMSSCNIWFDTTLELFDGAKKRAKMRQGMGVSPGRRLSHLARRRQFFSSANLQNLANADNFRQIEIKKIDHRGDEHKRKMNRTVAHEKLNSSKRALFLSPDDGTPVKYGTFRILERKVCSSSEERKKLPLQENSKTVEVSKWLSQQNFDVDFPRKRLRDEYSNPTSERKRKCPRRSLKFGDDEIPKSPANNDNTQCNTATNRSAAADVSNTEEKRKPSSVTKLSQNHKNKLLWAVSVVLKENKISRMDENFKACASTLFHKCRKNLNEILNSQTGNGTSEKVLQYARDHISSIFDSLGIRPPEATAQDSAPATSLRRNESEQANRVSQRLSFSEDSKENVNHEVGKNRAPITLGERESADLLLFKTPKKVPRKRVVKSCQKLSREATRKRLRRRRWRSLESLIGNEEEIPPKMTESTDEERHTTVEEVKGEGCVAPNVIPETPDPIPTTDEKDHTSTPLKNVRDGGECQITFTPVPSSVQEDGDSPKCLYPALCPRLNHCDVTGDPSCEPSLDNEDSREISNQDKELKDGLKNSSLKETLDEEISDDTERVKERGDKEGNPPQKRTVPLSECDTPEKVDGDIEGPVEAVRAGAMETLVESNSKSKETAEDVDEEILDRREDVKQDEDVCERSGEVDLEPSDSFTADEDVSIGAYKPRKLLVKKSKPNWKVVRQNSNEAENQSNLRLKMRLSHEWEVVSRNSSCSEVDTNSLESSRRNLSDEKDLSSEVELEDSIRRDSFHTNYHTSESSGKEDEWNGSREMSKRVNRKYSFDNFVEGIRKGNGFELRSSSLCRKRSLANGEVGNARAIDATNVAAAVDKGHVKNEVIALDDSLEESADEATSQLQGADASPVLFEHVPQSNSSFKLSRREIPLQDNKDKSSCQGSSPGSSPSSSCRRSSDGGCEVSSDHSSVNSRKKLSLEKYKARKLNEAPKDSDSCERDEESTSRKKGKKIYNIRLKNPVRERRHGRHGDRLKRKREHDSEGRDCKRSAYGSRDESGNSETLTTQSDFQRGKEAKSGDVNVQTIVNALSALSNLVEQQIKLENDKMTAKQSKSSDESTGGTSGSEAKSNDWLEVVSSWCEENLSNVKRQCDSGQAEGRNCQSPILYRSKRKRSASSAGSSENGRSVVPVHTSFDPRTSNASIPSNFAATSTSRDQQSAPPIYSTNSADLPPGTSAVRYDPHLGVNYAYSVPENYVQKTEFDYYQSGIAYGNYGAWQFTNDAIGWTYPGSEAYQNGNYYPCQMPNLYYHNGF